MQDRLDSEKQSPLPLEISCPPLKGDLTIVRSIFHQLEQTVSENTNLIFPLMVRFGYIMYLELNVKFLTQHFYSSRVFFSYSFPSPPCVSYLTEQLQPHQLPKCHKPLLKRITQKLCLELGYIHSEESSGYLGCQCPQALCNCQGCLPQLWWHSERRKCLGAVSKSRSLTPAIPRPLGIVYFKHWKAAQNYLHFQSADSAVWVVSIGTEAVIL